MREELLIVEDLTLLMLDDKTGAIAGAGTMHYSFGGALLAELALLGRVEIDESGKGLNGPKVFPVGDGPLEDPLLQSAYDKVAERTRRVQPLIHAIGGGLHNTLIDRLLERGLIRRENKRLLGVFRTTRLPAEDTGHEAELRRKVCAVLEDGERPDARTATVIALLSSSGVLPTLDPTPKWSGKVHNRGKELEKGDWGAEAVSTAVTWTAAAITMSTAAAQSAVAATVITSTT